MNLETVTIEVSPQTAEVLRQLQTQAAARQVPLDAYLRTLAEVNDNSVNHGYAEPEAKQPRHSSQEKVAALNALVAGLDRNAAPLSDEAISRESIDAPENETPLLAVELTPQEKARRWMEFVTAYSVNVPYPVDDSRESIYTREDEML
jgi:hypothetical protein